MCMILNKVDNNYYILKFLNTNFDIYDKNEVEKFTKNIIKKILKNNNLNGYINFEVYLDKNYGMIINIYNKENNFIEDEIDVKITFNLEDSFLYLIDYFDIIENNLNNQNIYYHNNKFYLDLTKSISKKDYYRLLELSEIIYENTFSIKEQAIKL